MSDDSSAVDVVGTFVLEKIRTGETEPYEVVTLDAMGGITVENLDDGTVEMSDAGNQRCP